MPWRQKYFFLERSMHCIFGQLSCETSQNCFRWFWAILPNIPVVENENRSNSELSIKNNTNVVIPLPLKWIAEDDNLTFCYSICLLKERESKIL